MIIFATYIYVHCMTTSSTVISTRESPEQVIGILSILISEGFQQDEITPLASRRLTCFGTSNIVKRQDIRIWQLRENKSFNTHEPVQQGWLSLLLNNPSHE